MITPLGYQPDLSVKRRRILPADVVLRLVWQGRVRILRLVSLFIVAGIVVALIQQPEFTSAARIMPEMNNGASDLFKRLSSVAGFADVDFSDGEGMDAIRPDLYPNVLQSTPFILYLIEQPASTITGKVETVGSFLATVNRGWAWKKWLALLKPEASGYPTPKKPAGTVRLSVEQQELAEEIGERVKARLDTRSGLITITTQMPDAYVAATVTQLAMTYLTQYVTNYRTEKARQDLAFYGHQLAEVRKRYQKAQLGVFQYNDNHKNLVMLAATMDRQRMQAELTIAQTVYTELSRQYEQAKLKVQERTPIFKVLEPPSIPIKRTSPKRIVIVLCFALAGLLTGILSVLIQQADIMGQLRTVMTSDAASV